MARSSGCSMTQLFPTLATLYPGLDNPSSLLNAPPVALSVLDSSLQLYQPFPYMPSAAHVKPAATEAKPDSKSAKSDSKSQPDAGMSLISASPAVLPAS